MSPSERDRDSVVVPAVGAPSSTAVLRSLGRRGVYTILVTDENTSPATWSTYCNEKITVPSPTEDRSGYRDSLLDLAKRKRVRAITPMREADVFVLAKNHAEFAKHIIPIWPSFSTLETVHDREQLFAAARRADVPIPETEPLDEVDVWDTERIVKARFAILASEYVDDAPPNRIGSMPKTMFLEPGVKPDVQSIVEEMGHVPIAQEYVRGTEYCLRALYDDGEPVATSQKRLIRGIKYPRGPSIYHEAVDIPKLKETGLALLDELEWHGVASVGFIRDDAGRFKLLEVNPRLWSQVSMDIRAGVDYPHYLWQMALGDRITEAPEYKPGIATHILRGEAVHLHSVLFDDFPLAEPPSVTRTIWETLTSLYRHPHFDYLDADDPGPFLRDVLNTVQTISKRNGSK